MKAVYLPLTTNHYNTVKSLEIRMNHGWEGYGIYIYIWQKLASTEAREFKISELKLLAYDLHISLDILTSIIDQYFESDGITFHSDELNTNLSFYDAKYKKQSDAGKKTQAQLTPEQRTEKAKYANDVKYGRVEKDNNTQVVSTNVLSNLGESPNNRIEQNRTELNRTEKNRIEQNQKNENQNFSSSDLVSSSSEKNEVDNTSKDNTSKDNTSKDNTSKDNTSKDNTSIEFKNNNTNLRIEKMKKMKIENPKLSYEEIAGILAKEENNINTKN